MGRSDKLVEENYKLINYTIKLYCKNFLRYDYTYDDMVSNGQMGLLVASRKYDKNKGKFSTYAILCIYRYIQNGYIKVLKENDRNIKLLNKLSEKEIYEDEYNKDDDINDEIKNIIYKLEESEKIKDILYYYYSNKLKVSEIASLYDISETYVYKVINNHQSLRGRIRKLLKGGETDVEK